MIYKFDIMGKIDLQKELVNDIQSLLIQPITSADYSYSKVKDLVQSQASFSKLNIYTSEILHDIEERLLQIKQAYEIKIVENEYDRPYSVTCEKNASNSVDIDGLFQAILVIFGITMIGLFTYNYYITYKLPQHTMQLIGIWLVIISLMYLFTQVIDIMNNGVQNGNGIECNAQFKQLVENSVHKLFKSVNSEHIRTFLKQYIEYTNQLANSHINSKKNLEDFLVEQQQFMLKSENPRLSHQQTKKHLTEFLQFLLHTNQDQNQLIVKEYINTVVKDNDDITRKQLHRSVYLKPSTLHKWLIEIDQTNDEDKLKQLYTDDALYNYLTTQLISSIKNIINSSPQIRDVLVINIVLRIFKITNLPEHSYLHDFIFLSSTDSTIKELSNLQTLNDRYITITSESQSLTNFKTHLLQCVSGSNSLNATSKVVTEICKKNQSISNEGERVSQTIMDLLKMVKDVESKFVLMNKQLVELLSSMKTESIDDIHTTKYDMPLKLILFAYEKKFEHTPLTPSHIAEYLLKTANAHNDFENPTYKTNFVYNLRNILKIIGHEMDESKRNKHIINNNKKDTTSYLISFEQFIHKLNMFNQTDLLNLQRKYEIMYNEAANVIENSDKTRDNSSVKKVRIFKVMMFLYMVTSFSFMSQSIYNRIMNAIFNQSGGGDGMKKLKTAFNTALEQAKKIKKSLSSEINTVYENNEQFKTRRSEMNMDKIDEIDKEADKLFDVVIQVIYLFSGWVLSLVLLYSYWLKLDSDLTFNDMVRNNNSKRMENTLKTMSTITKELLEVSEEKQKTTLYKRLYEEYVVLLDLDNKCNMIHPMNGIGGLHDKSKHISFPWNEIAVSILLIGFIVAILVFQAIFNNPFEIWENIKHIRRAATLDLLPGPPKAQSGGEPKPSNTTSKKQGPTLREDTILKDFTQDIDINTLQESLYRLKQIESKLSPIDQNTITNVSLAGSTLVIALMLSYTVMNNALKYKYDLFNGGLFSESRCW